MYHLINAICLLVNIPFIVRWIATGHPHWANLIAAVFIVVIWVFMWRLHSKDKGLI